MLWRKTRVTIFDSQGSSAAEGSVAQIPPPFAKRRAALRDKPLAISRISLTPRAAHVEYEAAEAETAKRRNDSKPPKAWRVRFTQGSETLPNFLYGD
jgi:hypothetical protein